MSSFICSIAKRHNLTHLTLAMKFLKSLRCLILVGFFLTSCSSGEEDSPQGAGGNPDLNNKTVGESANDLLALSNYTALEVELLYAAGHKPPAASVDYLRNFLANRVNKPAGITLVQREISTPEKTLYTLQELKDIETGNRTLYNEGSTIKVYFFFADGGYAPNNNVLGIAYKNTSMVLFQSRIEELSGGVGQSSTSLLTSSVLGHEFGHILGLVNAGSTPQSDHQDTANGRHCDITDCLMYYAVESTAGLSDLLGASAPPSLDAQCLADLRANGGK
ncbi:MAG: hypothetical protein ACJAXB_001476 [Candidatus Endobugula sp.]